MTSIDHLPAPSSPDRTPSPSDWSYTNLLKENGIDEKRRKRERMLGSAERHTIERDSRIDGGVYEGTYGGEAIVVDKEKYPKGFQDALGRIMQRIQKPDGTIDKAVVLQSVRDIVSDMIRPSEKGVEGIFQEVGGVDGTKVALDLYVQRGVGECRHMALFAGQLLEALGDMGYIGGHASVERNFTRSEVDGKRDGHSWVRYTNSGGEVYILDVASGRLASLDKLMRARAGGDTTVWDYGRPEDHESMRGKVALNVVQGRVNTGNQPAVFIDRVPDWVLNASEVREPVPKPKPVNERISDLLADLSEKDKDSLWSYARELYHRALAQKEGNGEGSTAAYQRASAYYRDLSPEAKAKASQFVELFNAL